MMKVVGSLVVVLFAARARRAAAEIEAMDCEEDWCAAASDDGRRRATRRKEKRRRTSSMVGAWAAPS